MKKKILIAILTLGIVFSMSACNRQMIDLTYNYKYAIIRVTYLTHSTDVILMTKEPVR